MEKDITLNGRRLVLQDPHESLTRAAPQEWVLKQQERRARLPPNLPSVRMPEPQPAWPFESEPPSAQGQLLDGPTASRWVRALHQGWAGPVVLGIGWVVIGMPLLLLAWTIGGALLRRWDLPSPTFSVHLLRAVEFTLAESFPALGLLVLLQATFPRKRR